MTNMTFDVIFNILFTPYQFQKILKNNNLVHINKEQITKKHNYKLTRIMEKQR